MRRPEDKSLHLRQVQNNPLIYLPIQYILPLMAFMDYNKSIIKSLTYSSIIPHIDCGDASVAKRDLSPLIDHQSYFTRKAI